MILTKETESQFIADGFAHATGAGTQELLDADSVRHCCRVGLAPGRIATTGFVPGDIDRVFDCETQSIEQTASSWRHIESLDESIALSGGHGGAFHSS